VGDIPAATFYEACLLRTVDEVAACVASDSDCSGVLYFSEAADREELAALLEKHSSDTAAFPLALQLQSSSDLGARLHAALAQELSEADCVVVVGSDVPGLTAATLGAAVEALSGPADVVLGPALDGGFYLLGLKAAPPDLFADVRWSTEHTLADVLRNAAMLRLCIAPLSTCPTLRDVDTSSDLALFATSDASEGPLRALALDTLAISAQTATQV